MNDETIVAVFDTAAQADAATADLRAAGIPAEAIGRHADGAGTDGTGTPMREKSFWNRVFGGEPDHDTGSYDRSIAAGSTVVSVRAPVNVIPRVVRILEAHDPADVDERADRVGAGPGADPADEAVPVPDARSGAPETGATETAAGMEVMALAEERLAVGKRVVNRGSTRVRRYVVERPVERTVELHDERVVLERRPVAENRTPAADGFTDRTIEMTETAEEAVVAKTARVYEEVGLRRDAVDRTETIRDTVRREEVKVERIPGRAPADAVGPAGAARED